MCRVFKNWTLSVGENCIKCIPQLELWAVARWSLRVRGGGARLTCGESTCCPWSWASAAADPGAGGRGAGRSAAGANRRRRETEERGREERERERERYMIKGTTSQSLFKPLCHQMRPCINSILKKNSHIFQTKSYFLLLWALKSDRILLEKLLQYVFDSTRQTNVFALYDATNLSLVTIIKLLQMTDGNREQTFIRTCKNVCLIQCLPHRYWLKTTWLFQWKHLLHISRHL